MESFFDIDGNNFKLHGEWTTKNLAEIMQALPKSISAKKIDASNLQTIDTSGAYLLYEKFGTAEQKKIVEVVNSALPLAQAEKTKGLDFVQNIGKIAMEKTEHSKAIVSYIGEFGIVLLRTILNPMRLRFTATTHQLMQAGIKALPIVALIAFLIAVVLVYQGSVQLTKFGADIFVVDLVSISILREMGVLLTAVMIAGRSGSAFTAEIGVMKVNEEIDAMRTMGLNPLEIVVLPRVIALIIILPLLTFVANLAGLYGGAFAANSLLDISYTTFFDRVQSAVKINHFWVGMIKAPFFGIIIAMTSCMRGMQVSGSSDSVGRYTTKAVVETIFLVFIADAIFSILFVKMGI